MKRNRKTMLQWFLVVHGRMGNWIVLNFSHSSAVKVCSYEMQAPKKTPGTPMIDFKFSNQSNLQ